MSELLQAIFLGMVQGLTEFLPVSSSGHLLLAQYFLGFDQKTFGLSFDAALHLGTLAAVVWFFRRDLARLAVAFARSIPRPDFSQPEQRLSYLILVSTVPGALLGFFFEGFFQSAVRSPWIVAINLAVVGALFLIAEAAGKRSRKIFTLRFPEAVGIGLAQAAALVPGVSRSGATITIGLFLGLRREEAARFSFLMGVPIIAGAGSLSLAEVVGAGISGHEALLFGVGLASSAVVGYLAIGFLLKYLVSHSLRAFAYYRFALAGVVLILLAFGR